MANFIIPSQPDSGQEPRIPLYPNLDSLTPGNPDLTTAAVYLLAALAISHLLTGGPELSQFSIPDLITAGRRLWRLYLIAVARETEE